MSWIELKLDIPTATLEQLSSYLFAHGCEGINVTDDGIIIYFTTHRWSDELHDPGIGGNCPGVQHHLAESWGLDRTCRCLVSRLSPYVSYR